MNNPQSNSPESRQGREKVQGGSEYDDNMETASERYSEKPRHQPKSYPELQEEKLVQRSNDDLHSTKRAKKSKDFRKYTNP